MYNINMRRANERVERNHRNNGSHNYRSRGGPNIPKGYGHPIYAETSARRESVIQATVQGNLRWMASRFLGFRLRKNYQGMWYAGAVRRVGWHRQRGYGGTVEYEDGYVEVVPMSKLVDLHQQKEQQEKQKGNRLMRSLSEGGEQEVWWKRVQWPVENDSLIDVTRETGLMHERYVGVAFEKVFGELGVFIGVVQEVWRNDQCNDCVRVVYDGGDCEDISIKELRSLVSEGATQESRCGSGLEGSGESIKDANLKPRMGSNVCSNVRDVLNEGMGKVGRLREEIIPKSCAMDESQRSVCNDHFVQIARVREKTIYVRSSNSGREVACRISPVSVLVRKTIDGSSNLSKIALPPLEDVRIKRSSAKVSGIPMDCSWKELSGAITCKDVSVFVLDKFVHDWLTFSVKSYAALVLFAYSFVLFLNCNLRGSVECHSMSQISILNTQPTFTNIPKLQLTEFSKYQPTVPSYHLRGKLINPPTTPLLFCLLLYILLPSLTTDTSWGNISVLDAFIKFCLFTGILNLKYGEAVKD